MSSRALAAGVSLLAAGAATALLVLLVGQSVSGSAGLVSLLQSAPVYYVQSSAVPAQLAQQQMQTFYIPQSVLPQASAAMMAPRITSLAVPKLTLLAGNATNSTNMPPGWTERTCAITNLVMQAAFVFPQWDQCGYLFHGQPEESISAGTGGVISAPPNDPKCTPDKMHTDPCRKEWIRTVARNNLHTLVDCLTKVKGLSQTCDTFKKCGPTPGFSPLGLPGDVCSSPDGGYYKEASIERMCGVCDMYHAIAGMATTDRAHDHDEDEDEDSGGCFAAESEVEVEGRGRVELRSVRAGDRVKTHDNQFQGVYFVHEHKQPARTVELALGGDAEGKTRTLRLTPTHYLPVWGRGMVAAGSVVAGDRVWVGEAGEAVEVAAVSSGKAEAVVWVLVEGEELLVNGIRASVWSSPAQAAETLPFRALAALAPTLLQWEPVAAAISAVLESPLRKAAAAATVALLFPAGSPAAKQAGSGMVGGMRLGFSPLSA